MMLTTLAVIMITIGFTASPEPRMRLLTTRAKIICGAPKATILRYWVPYSMMSGVAPNVVRINSVPKTETIMKSSPQNKAKQKVCPATWLVASGLFSPKRRETRAATPIPVPIPTAAKRIW
jgi:hypothetical protein